MAAIKGRETRPTNGQDHDRLSPCVCRTLRMVDRAVTQLYDNVLRPSGLRVTQVSIRTTIAHLGKANLRQLESMLAIDQGGDVNKGLAEPETQAQTMIDDLLWWTIALKTARKAQQPN